MADRPLEGRHALITGGGTGIGAATAELVGAAGAKGYPNLLDGVAGIRSLNQRDGIHPNAAGVKVIARRLAPVVAKALAVHR